MPLIAAVLYTIAGLTLKRAMAEGAGLLRISVLTNTLLGLFFAPLLFFAELPATWDPWWAPVVCGAIFFAGNVCTFAAIRCGDVSVQTPLMGTKAIFVALIVLALGSGPIPLAWWWAAGISAVGIFLLTYRRGMAKRGIGLGAVLALSAAILFAAADALLAHFAPRFGSLPLAAFMMLTVSVLSFSIIPYFSAPFSAIPRTAWPWVAIGCGLSAFQALLISGSVAFFQAATQANILYSSRGMWSVVLVLTVGRFFGNEERLGGRSLMIRRLTGALLMTIAIVLATL